MSDRYAEALAEHGLGDVQPLYRRMLVRMKDRDRSAYDEAVERYRKQVEEATADADDPVAVWVDYGVWLADRLEPGTLKAIDENGRASEAGAPPPLGPMLLHLPDDSKASAVVLAMPSVPSPAQSETASLLCG